MPVLVTGATGHIGNSLCRALLAEGRTVRGTIRSTSNLEPIQELDIETAEANLLVPDSLVHAMAGCDVVYHTAAVYKTAAVNPELEIIKPAIEGTRNVLQAAKKQGIRKLIYVSSAVSIGGGDSFDHGRGPSDWNENPASPYNVAKTRSEQVAREMAKELDLNVVFVLPGLVLGPNDYKITPSNGIVRDFLNGKIPFSYDGALSVTDVRDVVEGMLLAEKHGLPGERYILAGTGITIADLLQQISEMSTRSAPAIHLSSGAGKVLAHPVKWISGMFHTEPMITPEFVEDYFGKYYNFSSAASEEKLGYSYRPLLRILEDTINWLIQRGEVSPDVRVVENS
ncbi:MAG: NAD-dependent epimerase/dehydratase family protein [Candidatus Marinimicrobia bacterium]|nr:NAD-dependent epimerase/dehydratase family protein [Candidatus Neomarinimicrobiota bacterium]MCF7829955.1 NAD-dependent epimerase/dehydratase family protein [Candidatus Neomarinimicrobiota bacterium]MCF7881891.1 NAD-dependent epimerase/dehydratase family protein [Candidatus Neomarinimicrobiota bacterium]